MQNSDLTLYAFPTAPGFFNLSPYGVKAELLLQMAGLDYKVETPEDHTVMPKGKLPILKHGEKLIPDSEFIRLYIQDTFGYDYTAALTPEQNATAHALTRMLDERTSLMIIMSRWVDDEGWAQTKSMFFAEAPEEVAAGAREGISGNVLSRDTCRHSREEIVTLLRADLKAVSDTLSDTQYLFGAEPTYADAAVFGHIANLYGSPVRTWTTAIVAEFPTLIAYYDRCMARWYPDAAKMVA